MELSLENHTIDRWTVVRVSGELDLHTSPQLRDHTLSLLGEPPVQVALDMSDVSFMDSSSLGMLVTCLKRVRERDGRLVLAGVNGSPLKVFTLTGLDRVFDMVPSVEELPKD